MPRPGRHGRARQNPSERGMVDVRLERGLEIRTTDGLLHELRWSD